MCKKKDHWRPYASLSVGETLTTEQCSPIFSQTLPLRSDSSPLRSEEGQSMNVPYPLFAYPNLGQVLRWNHMVGGINSRFPSSLFRHSLKFSLQKSHKPKPPPLSFCGSDLNLGLLWGSCPLGARLSSM